MDGSCLHGYVSIGGTLARHSTLTFSELIQRKQPVDHGTIVTIGGTGQDNEEQEEVGVPQVLELPPTHVGELFACNFEVAGSWFNVGHDGN